MQGHVPSPAWAIEPKGLSDMRRLAKHVVDSMPRVQAAILFGSQARKSAGKRSDWDVALLAPERYRKKVLEAVPSVPAVNYVLISPKGMHDRYNRAGTLERSVAEDGVVLAGEWEMPKSRKRHTVSSKALQALLISSASCIDQAFARLKTVIRLDWLDQGDNSLCANSQDAAERLAKAAILHLGIHPYKTHKVLTLADALCDKHPNHPWIETIRSFNGDSATRHVSVYCAETEESTEDSLTRLQNVLVFYQELIEAISKKRPGFSKRMSKVCSHAIQIASNHQSDIDWESVPSELKRELLLWKQKSASMLKNHPNAK